MSSYRMLRVIPIQCFVATLALYATAPSASVIISDEMVPPGGTVQLKYSLSKPGLIAAGELAVDLDPAVFGSVTAAYAFSANGDAYGLAKITGLHVDVHFGSQSAGVGQLPGVPIVVVTATVLATAVAGKTASVTADPSGSAWNDSQGNTYSVSVSAGAVTIGGTLSITGVTPGGGLLTSGTVIEIDGTGFSSSTTVQIDGASIASMQVSDPQKMLLTLGGPTELTGKRIRVANPDGSEVDAFAFMPGVPVSGAGDVLDGVLPILPLQTYTAAAFFIGGSESGGGMAIRNPNPVVVEILLDYTDAVGFFNGERSLTIPAGGSLFDFSKVFGSQGGMILVIASAPVQIVQLTEGETFVPSSAYTLSASALSASTVPPRQVIATTQDQSGALSWVWQKGTAVPQAQSVSLEVSRGQPDTDVTVSAMTSSGGNWLSVTPTGARVPAAFCPGCNSLQVSVNPASLTPGIYRGTVEIMPVSTAFWPEVVPAVIPVVLTVTASPLAQTIIANIYLNPNVTSESVVPPPGMFSGPVALNVVIDSGGNWLSATPNSASAPTSITLLANPTGLGVGSYTGDVVVTGSGNTLVIPVHLLIDGAPRLDAVDPTTGGNFLNFVTQAGAGTLPTRLVTVSTEDCSPTECFNVNPDLSSLAVSVQTHSGGAWLSANVSQGSVLVSANAAGLSAGVYLGAVTLAANDVASGQFPVLLLVESGPLPALVAGPGLFFFRLPSGAMTATPVCVTSDQVPTTFGVQVSTSDGGGWLHAVLAGGTTPVCSQVYVDATALTPGAYNGKIVISGGPQSVTIPVEMSVTEQVALGPPLLGSVASAASELTTALSPGEIVTIHGLNLGPSPPAGPSLNAQGQFSTAVAGVSVLFGGYPGPILYASQTQINTVVPYEAAGSSAITVQVQNGNVSTAEWAVPSAPSAPGIFTVDYTGLGSGAVLNSDSSLNTPSNPATQGTTIQIFATGEGLTNPPGMTGSVATDQHQPVLPVGVSIGGSQAQIVYAGSAPTEIQGLFQVNAVVPNGIMPGNAIPILLTVGQAQSQAGTTIAVQ